MHKSVFKNIFYNSVKIKHNQENILANYSSYLGTYVELDNCNKVKKGQHWLPYLFLFFFFQQNIQNTMRPTQSTGLKHDQKKRYLEGLKTSPWIYTNGRKSQVAFWHHGASWWKTCYSTGCLINMLISLFYTAHKSVNENTLKNFWTVKDAVI